MWQNVNETVLTHLRFYKKYAAIRWEHLSPMEYGSLLMLIGLIGFICMRNAGRK